MIYITQLIYIVDGQEAVFQEFEDMAIPVIRKYGGKLLLRIRPDHNTIIHTEGKAPYELHLVCFLSQADFEAFKADEGRKQYLHLKEASVRSALIIQGQEL